MFKFKKIASILASTVMLSSTVALAAAANYPAPFIDSGTTAIVWGGPTNAPLDSVAVIELQGDLTSRLVATGVTGTGTPSYDCGDVDCVLLAKSSDNLNLGNTWGVFTGTVDDSDLTTLLADGTYVADDGDDFDYEQTINLGAPTLTQFRDSDYENLMGLDTNTPIVGFHIGSTTSVMNYTLDFTSDAESVVSSSGDLTDFEGSDLPLFGKTYYVSDFKNGTSSTYLGKLTLLDSASISSVSAGQTVTVEVDGETYEVGIDFIDGSHVRYTVNGNLIPSSGKMTEGQNRKIADNVYIGARTIDYNLVAGEVGKSTFSIGAGKLEIQGDGSDIKLNDNTVQGVKGYTYRTTGTSGTEKLDKIVIEWLTDEEAFLTPGQELVMPGFETVKFTMNDLVRAEEEKVTIENDGDTSIKMTVPIKDGDASFNLLYSESATGNFTGIGKSATERLAVSNSSLLTFTYRDSGNAEYDKWFVATYAGTSDAESYLLKATVRYNSDTDRNETDIINVITGDTICDDYYAGKACSSGMTDVSFTVGTVRYTSGGLKDVNFTAGSNVNFNTIYTTGGLRIYLPHLVTNTSTVQGGINMTGYANGPGQTGHDEDTWYLFMDGENKEDTIAGGTEFNLTINNDGTTTNGLQVSQVNNAGTGGSGGLEIGSSSGLYQNYIVDDVAPRVLHYTKGDPDYAEVYYPTGDSETYANVLLTEVGAQITSNGGTGGTGGTGGSASIVSILDSEVGQQTDANMIVIGGSCVNSYAASLLGVSPNTCGSDWTSATTITSGQYLIQTFDRTGGKIATLAAGYNVGDTKNAVTYLTTQDVDTSVDAKYIDGVKVESTATQTGDGTTTA